MISYTVLRSPEKQQYRVADFLFPYYYPYTTKTSNFPAFRVAKCLYNLKDVGITVKSAQLDLEIFPFSEDETLEEDDEDGQGFIKRLWSWFTSKKPQKIGEKWLQQQFSQSEYISIRDYGGGDFTLPEDLSFAQFKELTFPLIAPYFFVFDLDVDRKKLQKAITKYDKEYQAGKLLHQQRNLFGYTLTEAIIQAFLDRLHRKQDNFEEMIFRPLQDDDELLKAFALNFPDDYQDWSSGIYELPLLTHFISMELGKRLKIKEVKVSKPQLSQWKPNINSNQLNQAEYKAIVDHLGAKVETEAIMVLEGFAQQQSKQKVTAATTITSVEIVPSDDVAFTLYVNSVYDNPIKMSKRSKYGRLLYDIAEYDRAPSEDPRHESGLGTINRSHNIKLWTQSGINCHPLLYIDDEGDIVAAQGITISFYTAKK